MLPSREQDYSSSYFRTIFPKVVRLLRETKVFLITTQAKRNLSSRSGIGGVRSAT